MKRSMDMLHGKIWTKLLAFAFPLALTGILQQLFNAADVAVIGRFVGKNAMAAVGSNAALVSLMVNLIVGISLGANVVIANLTGKGDRDGVRRGVHAAVLFSAIAGVAAAAVALLLSTPLLRLLDVPDEVMEMSLKYFRIYVAGLPFILIYNTEAAIFRSQGDTRTPLICLLTAGIVNVGLNVFFILVVGMTTDGVALATLLSNLLSSVMLFVLLYHSPLDIRLRFRDFRLDRALLKEMLRIGMPAGLQGAVFSVSNVCIQSAINGLGADIMAASAAGFNIEALAFYILNSFGQAGTTFVSQNYGAGNLDRCRRITRVDILLGVSLSVVFSGLLLVFCKPLLALFNSDPVVYQYGRIRLAYILLFEGINTLNELLSGAMRGFGYSLVPATVTLAGICGTRIIWVFGIYPMFKTFEMLMACYPISWTVTLIILTVFYLRFRKTVYGKAARTAPQSIATEETK